MSIPTQSFTLINDNPVLLEAWREKLDTLAEKDKAMSDTNRMVYANKGKATGFLNEHRTYVSNGTAEAMLSDTPPTIEFLLGTPNVTDLGSTVLRNNYVVYAVILSNDNESQEADKDNDFRVYIGSASCAAHGAKSRIVQYETQYMLGQYVKKSLDQGYSMIHIGVLMILSKPAIENHPVTRLWILTNESLYTHLFWTVHQKGWKKSDDHYLRYLCPWNLDELEWLGLNSHSALMETPQNMMLSEKELLRRAEEAAKRKRAHEAKYQRSEKGKATAERYAKSDKGKATAKRYLASDHGRVKVQEYLHSDKGKENVKRYQQSEKGMTKRQLWEKSDEGKASMKKAREKYRNSEKGKAARAKESKKRRELLKLKG